MDSYFDISYKILVVGDSQVGKSSLISRFADGCFDCSIQPTIGVDFRMKTVNIQDDKVAKLQIWDTAGQERFRPITSSYFRNANGVIIVFDITNYSSFLSIGRWVRCITDFHTPPIIIVGHKADLYSRRVVSFEQARDEAQRYNATYLESSSLSPSLSSSPNEIFTEIAMKIYSNEKAIKPQPIEKSKRFCCLF